MVVRAFRRFVGLVLVGVGLAAGILVTPALGSGDFGVAVTDAPDPVAAGGNITYTFSLTYGGNGTGVRNGVPDTGFSISFSGGGSIVTAPSLAGFSCTSYPNVMCVPVSPAPFAAGETRTFTAVVYVGVGGATTRQATILVNSIGDSTPNDNQASATTTVLAGATGTATTTVLFSGHPNPGVVGQNIELEATVSGVSVPGTPTGTVTFIVNGTPQAPVALVNGTASIFRNDLPVGFNGVAIDYSGDNIYAPNSDRGGSELVRQGTTTTTTLSSSSNPSAVGGTVTFTATVAGPSGTGPTPTGDVTFLIDGTPSATMALSGGMASLTTSSLSAGAHTITANYAGTSSYSPSTDMLSQNVTGTAASTTTTLTSAPNPSTSGQPVTLSATVTPVAPATGTPTGTVTFSDGGTVIGTGTIAGGVATLTTSSLADGSHTLTATYGGDGNFSGSTSNTVTQQVDTATVTPPVNPPPVATDAATLGISFNPARFSAAGEVIGVAYAVSNTGTTVLAGLSITDAKVPAIACPSTTLAPGASTTCAGTYTVTDADVAAGSIAFTATASANGHVVAAAAASITSATLTQQVSQATDEFLRNRATLLAQNVETPGLHDRGAPGFINLAESGGSPVLNFAVSSLGAGADAAGELASGRTDQPFNAWIDGTLSVHAGPTAGGNFALVGMGADYLLHDDVLLGVALYVDVMSDSSATTTVRGTGVLTGPYVSIGLTNSVTLDAMLLYGGSHNDITTSFGGQTFAGSFDTTRWLGKIKLEGEWLLDEITVRPDLTAVLTQESTGSYVVASPLAGPVTMGGSSVSQIRLSAGTRIERTFDVFDGLAFTPSAGVRVGLTDPTARAPLAGAFGTLTLGLTLSDDSWRVGALFSTDVEASGFTSASLRASVGGSF